MTHRLANVVVDSADPRRLARFWAELLGWPVAHEAADEVDVRSPHAPWTFDLVFVPVTEPRNGKNRIHLDLASSSPGHQLELVERAVRLGARPADVGQHAVPWVVLADPEGNEFCVLEPRPEYAETGAVAAVVVDVPEPSAAAAFWSTAAGLPVGRDDGGVAGLRPPPGLPWLEFLPAAAPKAGKDRLHLDVDPVGDQAAAVAELERRGAVRADIGQGPEASWVVLADPWGGEFCVLRPGVTGPGDR
ncbi:VOC family protein [Pseudonocardia yuanmonensis]|uniref:VOC family protein n=1 Tax=Pseudonocardia yuanmonensis TaxID=1095914 RepID=A0ABP8XGI5_9PSEU